MVRASPAALSWRVTWTSADDGTRLPDRWLCERMTDRALTRSAHSNTSFGEATEASTVPV
jgi:hypothetical protein